MNLQQLQSALKDERSSDRLQSISETFYSDAETFITELREDREEAAENAPNVFDSREVMNLSQKIQRGEETLKKLYNRRVGKIINQAVLAASGGSFDKDPLTQTERDLYNTIIEAVNNNRSDTLDVLSEGSDTASMFSSTRDSTDTVASLADETESTDSDDENDISEYMGEGSTDTETSASTDSEPEPESNTTSQSGGFAADVGFGEEDQSTQSDPTNSSDEENVRPAPPEDTGSDPDIKQSPDQDNDFTDEFESGTDAESSPNDSGNTSAERADGGTESLSESVSRVTVQVTQDVGEVYGIDDRTYDLSEEDVVSLPEENAKPLLENNAAITLD